MFIKLFHLYKIGRKLAVSGAIDTVNEIYNLPFFIKNFQRSILKNNKCLLLCDGGDKPKEIQIYSEYLQDGSYIMGHDYAPTKDYFHKNIKIKIWNWLELQDSDFEETMEKHNLYKSKKYYDKFKKVVWVCLVKGGD